MNQPAILLSYEVHVRDVPGGVQICTREYIDTLKAAGFDLDIITHQPKLDFWARVDRRLFRRPYTGMAIRDLVDQVSKRAREINAVAVFLNLNDFAPIAESLRKSLPEGCKIVLLSHGLESVDYLHTIRINHDLRTKSPVSVMERLRLASQILFENRSRRFIDLVYCLAPFEVEYERWLGARRVCWLPRTVRAKPINWQPVAGRIGCATTIDHPPNFEGMTLFCREFARIAPQCEVRFIGGPKNDADSFSGQFSNVRYLGPLSDAEFQEEARSWCAFVQPLFCFARGCSTKLAIGLGMEIPVVTTPSGARGYTWTEGGISLGETPAELAALSLRLATDAGERERARENIRLASRSCPTLEEVAKLLRDSFDSIDKGAQL